MKKSCLALAVAFLTTLLAHAGEVRTLGGGAVEGAVLRVGAGGVEVKPADGPAKTVPLSDVLSVELVPPPKDAPAADKAFVRVRLIDGSDLKAEEVAFQGAALKLKLPGGMAAEAPLAAVASILFEAQDRQNADDFQAALANGPKGDLVRLVSRDGKAVNAFEGVVGEAGPDGKTLRFTPDGGEAANLAVPRLRAIAFARTSPRPEAKLGFLLDQAGNRFALAQLDLGEKAVKLTTPTGINLELPRAAAVRLDLSQGKLAYLSDLEPLRVETEHLIYAPPSGLRYGRDKTLKGTPLSLGRKGHAKGIAVHAKTILDYDVAGYNSFRCVLGLDDSVSRVGAAFVRIEGDGKELFSQAVSLRDPKPHEVELKIAGVKRLRLIVDFGDDLDLGDHVDFADARVMK